MLKVFKYQMLRSHSRGYTRDYALLSSGSLFERSGGGRYTSRALTYGNIGSDCIERRCGIYS
jgi:hypothetical protein